MTSWLRSNDAWRKLRSLQRLGPSLFVRLTWPQDATRSSAWAQIHISENSKNECSERAVKTDNHILRTLLIRIVSIALSFSFETSPPLPCETTMANEILTIFSQT